MSIRTNLPAVPAISMLKGVASDISPSALGRWQGDLRSAEKDDDHTISILGAIGPDFFGEGVTARRISAALRSIGSDQDITVHINSPGGDFFEGLSIYNLLREHKGIIKVKVLGLAASAASVIAMAGDEIQIAKAGFLMIHNTWIVVMGDRHDMMEAADWLEPFDKVSVGIYAAQTGMDEKAIAKMMDKETWINGSEAVEQGFANSLLSADEVKKDTKASTEGNINAAARIHAMLAKAGLTRTERTKLLNAFKSGTQNAADDATQNAGVDQGLLAQLSEISISTQQ